MPHFFVNSTDKNQNFITIDDKENYRHIARALRARVGEKLLLIDENQISYYDEDVIDFITKFNNDYIYNNDYIEDDISYIDLDLKNILNDLKIDIDRIEQIVTLYNAIKSNQIIDIEQYQDM